MKAIELHGHTFTAEDVAAMRQIVIDWRDRSMEQWPEAIPFTADATTLIAFLYEVLQQYPGYTSARAER